jgi:hypothetical protein
MYKQRRMIAQPRVALDPLQISGWTYCRYIERHFTIAFHILPLSKQCNDDDNTSDDYHAPHE